MSQNEKAKQLIEEAEALSETSLQRGLAKLREALALAPDYPELDNEIYLREDAISKLDDVLEHIRKLYQEGKGYRASQLLRELPENYEIDHGDELINELKSKISRVEELSEQARKLPKTGSSAALPMLEEAAALISDYPGLQEDIAALRSSKAQYDVYLGEINAAIAAKDLEKARELLDTFKEVYPHDENVGKYEVALRKTRVGMQRRSAVKKSFVKIIASVMGILLLLVGYTVFEFLTFNSADQSWQNVEMLLAQEKYKEAWEVCDQITAKLAKVRIFLRSDKIILSDKVAKVYNSDEVIQGAKGKVLVDGEYISKESVPEFVRSKTIIEEAEQLRSAGRFEEALKRYETVAGLFESLEPGLAEQLSGSVRAAIGETQMMLLNDQLKRASAALKQNEAAVALKLLAESRKRARAFGLSESDQIFTGIDRVEVEARETMLREMVARGDGASDRGEFKEAMDLYSKALAFFQENELADTALEQGVRLAVNRLKIRELVAAGHGALAASRWQDAIGKYRQALTLAKSTGLLEMKEMGPVSAKLRKAEKMVVMVVVAQTLRKADKSLKRNDMKKARKGLLKVLELVKSSAFAGDRDLVEYRLRAEKSLKEVEERIFINGKISELEKRYKSAFKKLFGLPDSTKFLNPEVIHTATKGTKLIFTVTAWTYEKTRKIGKYEVYEAVYSYDRSSDQWVLVSKAKDSRETSDRDYY